MPIMYTQIGHPAFLCNRYDETLDFYKNKLGFEEMFSLHHDDGQLWLTYFKIASGQFLELFYSNYPSDNITKDRAFHHFCLEVDNMTEILKELKEKNVEVYKGPADGGNRLKISDNNYELSMCGSICAFIRDPEGNDIELMQFTDESKQLK